MALKKKPAANTTKNSRLPKAPFWANVRISSPSGESFPLPRGLAGNLDNKVLRSMYNREQANRQAYDEMVAQLPQGSEVPPYQPYVFTATITLAVTPEDSDEDLIL